MPEYFIGIDLGGTKILTAIAGKDGDILARRKLPTEANKGQNKIIANIKETIKGVLEETGKIEKDITRIGVGSPGPLSVKKGIIYENSNLPWKNVPIVKLLEEEVGIRVVLENDANAAALGEKCFGTGQGVDNLLYITISTGIGGGIIIDGKIYHGASDGAGEIGHMTVHPDGPLCGCGNHGCFETLASGTAIAEMGRNAVVRSRAQVLKGLCQGDLNKIDAALVAQAAYQGDQDAVRIFENAGSYLGIGIANLINLFNPEMIILGGGVMKAEDLFIECMYKTLEERALTASREELEICRAGLGDDTGVKGAIAVARQ